MRRFIWPAAIVLAVALLVGLFVDGSSVRSGGESTDASGGGMGGGDSGVVGEPAIGAPDASGSDGGKSEGLDLGSLILPAGQSVIKYGDLGVVVEVGTFDAALEEATAVAARYGGFVVSTSVSGGERKSGYVSIRVRAADFDRAMADLRGLGDVESESVSGQDVGLQVVDLRARLDAWEAQRDVLLKLLDEARTVSDILKVQVELQNVQTNIEQLTAELTYLEDQVALSTISVYLREPGATEGIDEGPRFGDAWAKMVEAFLTIVFAMIVGLGYVVPIAIVLAAIVWAVRRYRRWRRA
jgi:hypothetical protein